MQNLEELDPLGQPIDRWRDRCLLELGVLQPEFEDPSVLFKNNWLAKGQAFGLVASAGVGKSSMTLQGAIHWAVGKAFLADPIRPLKIAIIQAEDSDRDLKEQRDGMIRGLEAEGMPREMIFAALSHIQFPECFIGVQSDKFIEMLAEYQREHDMDLIIINPLQRFFGGDVSSQEDASHFCAGLDKIMKDKEHGCAMGIVMHTPKFHSGIKDNRQSIDDYAEYAMAGSQEWTAWIRAVINFQKHGSSEEYFDVKASKRGKRLGWTDADGKPTTKRVFKHSEGFIYWQEVTDPEEIASIPEEAPKKSGRPTVEFDVKANCMRFASAIVDECGADSPMPLCKRQMREKAYEIINRTSRCTKDQAFDLVNMLFKDPHSFYLEAVNHPSYNGLTLRKIEDFKNDKQTHIW